MAGPIKIEYLICTVYFSIRRSEIKEKFGRPLSWYQRAYCISLSVIRVIQGYSAAGIWWGFAFLLFGLWMNYLFGIPGKKEKKKADQKAAGDNLSGQRLEEYNVIKKALWGEKWFRNQIMYQIPWRSNYTGGCAKILAKQRGPISGGGSSLFHPPRRTTKNLSPPYLFYLAADPEFLFENPSFPP